MSRLVISFAKQNVRLGVSTWLFQTKQTMRFEWLALLAFKRLTVPGDQAWVTLEEIAGLPHWRGKHRHHVATNIGRYLQATPLNRSQIVTAIARWAGPYRLTEDALSVAFDIPLDDVAMRLNLNTLSPSSTGRSELIGFTLSYARAQWLFFQGRLTSKTRTNRSRDYAYKRLMIMAGNQSYGSTLRLLACLSAVEVLYRLGQFRAARRTLQDNISLVRRTPDLSLKARYHLKLAWAHQRSSTSVKSDRAVKLALIRASSFAENSGDRSALGLLAHRRALYLTKKRSHMAAVEQLLLALEAYLIIADYDGVQATCGNIGSIIHRVGPKHYREARQWLLLSIAVARLMKLGRDDAHAEMILGKIYVEEGKCFQSRWLLKRAERIADQAGNRVNLADVKMVWGFWHQSFGKRIQQVQTLAAALRLFRSLTEFDVAQKEKYMSQRFPEVWEDVVAIVNKK
jgi:hypothetical protein